VALFSGVVATVDATQASEVIFALLGEMLFLGAFLPAMYAWFGMSLVFGGLGLFIFFSREAIK
jgi:hypothetical protein